jgi:hypothetical protein
MLEKILSSEIVQWLLISLITAFIGIVGQLLLTILNYAKKYLQSKAENQAVNNATGKLFDKVTAFVMDTYKSASEDLKAKIKDGKLTPEEKAEWKANLISHITLNSTSELNDLKFAGKDIENTIKMYAELAFADIKKKFLTKQEE